MNRKTALLIGLMLSLGTINLFAEDAPATPATPAPAATTSAPAASAEKKPAMKKHVKRHMAKKGEEVKK